MERVEAGTRSSLKVHGDELLRLSDAMGTVFSGMSSLEPKIWNTFNWVDQDLEELDNRVNRRKDDLDDVRKMINVLGNRIDGQDNVIAIQNDTMSCMEMRIDDQANHIKGLEKTIEEQSERVKYLEEKVEWLETRGDEFFISQMEFDNCLISYNQRMEEAEGMLVQKEAQFISLNDSVMEEVTKGVDLKNQTFRLAVRLQAHEEQFDGLDNRCRLLLNDITLEGDLRGDHERALALVRRDLTDIIDDDISNLDIRMVNIEDILETEQHCSHCPAGSVWTTLVRVHPDDDPEPIERVAGPSRPARSSSPIERTVRLEEASRLVEIVSDSEEGRESPAESSTVFASPPSTIPDLENNDPVPVPEVVPVCRQRAFRSAGPLPSHPYAYVSPAPSSVRGLGSRERRRRADSSGPDSEGLSSSEDPGYVTDRSIGSLGLYG